jgi:sec-independent protein translocase protein TatB
MFDIGMQELLLVGLVALVVLGPGRIPGTARQLGRAAVRIRKALRGLTRTLHQAMGDEHVDE